MPKYGWTCPLRERGQTNAIFPLHRPPDAGDTTWKQAKNYHAGNYGGGEQQSSFYGGAHFELIIAFVSSSPLPIETNIA